MRCLLGFTGSLRRALGPVVPVPPPSGGGDETPVATPMISRAGMAGTKPYRFAFADDPSYAPGMYIHAQRATSGANLAGGTLNGEATQQLTHADLADSADIVLADMSVTPDGPLAFRIRIGHENGLGGIFWSDWSNIDTDTIASAAADVTPNAIAKQAIAYASASAVFPAQAHGVGYGLVLVCSVGRTVVGGSWGSKSLVLIGNSGTADRQMSLYRTDSAFAGATSDTLTITGSSTFNNIAVQAMTLDPSYNPTPSSTSFKPFGYSADPQTSDVLTQPAGSVAIIGFGGEGPNPPVAINFTTGAPLGETHGSAAGDLTFATAKNLQGSAGNFQFSANGLNNSGGMLFAAVFPKT